VRLSQATDEELVGYLEKPNIWWRRTAQRLLVDRRSEKAVEPLKRMALAGASPLGRLHALWTLEGLGRLDPMVIEKSLSDADPGVRENAIILSEAHLEEPRLVDALVKMEGDDNARVRFQLLATLGSVRTRAAAQARRRLLDRDMEDPWVQLAALSASSDDALPALEAAIASRSSKTNGRVNYFRQLGSMIGARGKPAELAKVLHTAASMTGRDSDWWRAPVLDGLASGLGSRNATLQPQPVLLKLYDDDADDVRRAALRLLDLAGLPSGVDMFLGKAEATALDRGQLASRRADAIHLLSLAAPGKAANFYREFVEPRESEEVQTAAIHALGKQKGTAAAKFFLARWRSLTPAVRSDAVSALISDPERFQLLLEAIGRGEVQAWSLPLRQRVQMQMHRNPALRERARALLAAKAGDREEVLKRYQAVLDKTDGDASRGRTIYQNVCSKCHRFQGTGAEVGPDLATVRNRARGSLLNDILIPSQSIAQTYEAYVVETLSGKTLEGVIGEQTPTTLTLVHEQGEKDVIPRSEIKQMYVLNLSAMPEDVDKEVSPEQMADLIAYLKSTN